MKEILIRCLAVLFYKQERKLPEIQISVLKLR